MTVHLVGRMSTSKEAWAAWSSQCPFLMPPLERTCSFAHHPCHSASYWQTFQFDPLTTGSPSWSRWNTLVMKISGDFLELSLMPRKNIFCCIRRFLLPHGCKPCRMCAVTFDRCQAGQDEVLKVKLSPQFAFYLPM